MIALQLLACSRETIDLEATCAGVWPADDCAGDCVDGAAEQRWADTFLGGFAADARRDVGDLEDQVRLRTLDAAPYFQAVTSATWQLEVDWMRVVREVEVWVGDSAEPTDAELQQAWQDRVAAPAFDPDVELVPFAEVQAFVDDCAQQHGVTFDAAGWCDPYYGTQHDDDDPVGLRVDFDADVDEDGRYVSASFWLDGSGSDCGETQIPMEN